MAKLKDMIHNYQSVLEELNKFLPKKLKFKGGIAQSIIKRRPENFNGLLELDLVHKRIKDELE